MEKEEVIHSEAALTAAVKHAVDNIKVLDVHTHLFPASHGDLMLWGIDALLTYHYLVSEFFMVAPDNLSHKEFFAMQRPEQADLVWEHLFVRRLPLSEAAIGVVTSLNALGLQDELRSRDLAAIRKWFIKQDKTKHIQRVFALAGVDTVVMTNIPYDEREARVWRKAGSLPKGFTSALRVDLILTGDWAKLCQAMKREQSGEYGLAVGMELRLGTLQGLRKYLEVWAKRMKPEYLMASTPAGFTYTEIGWAQGLDVIESPSGIPTSNELIDKVLVPVALKLCLPLGIKIGAVRSMCPDLDPCGGGDGVQVADLTFLRLICLKYPQLRVLATVLSSSNQHELAVLAQKLRNLHIYGCWWYCNNPSMIEGITKMRMEMLGTNFTAQHSDARVLEQLIYKWKHAREAMSEAVITQHKKLLQGGWQVTRGDIVEEVWSLMGGSYKEFTDGGCFPHEKERINPEYSSISRNTTPVNSNSRMVTPENKKGSNEENGYKSTPQNNQRIAILSGSRGHNSDSSNRSMPTSGKRGSDADQHSVTASVERLRSALRPDSVSPRHKQGPSLIGVGSELEASSSPRRHMPSPAMQILVGSDLESSTRRPGTSPATFENGENGSRNPHVLGQGQESFSSVPMC